MWVSVMTEDLSAVNFQRGAKFWVVKHVNVSLVSRRLPRMLLEPVCVELRVFRCVVLCCEWSVYERW